MTDIQDSTQTAQEQADQALQRFADGFSWLRRSPVLHWPSEHGLDYEDITFPARDGVPLEGWFIPAPGSDKLIIANHPMGFSRSGMPADAQPWHADWAPSGNGFEVDLVPDYKILHDAGYHVLAYDLRNHGLSSGLEARIPQEWARNVRVPTFLYQVRHDSVTDPSDVQAMYDNIPVTDKKLQWIEGTTARFDGYLELQRRPQPMLDWFAQHMS